MLICFFNFKIISFMASWLYFYIKFHLIVPCFILAGAFKSLRSSKNVICIQVVYAVRFIAAIIAIIRDVCYGGSVIWFVLWEQKSKMKPSLFPIWHFAISLFLFVKVFILFNNWLPLFGEGEDDIPRNTVSLEGWIRTNVTHFKPAENWLSGKWQIF